MQWDLLLSRDAKDCTVSLTQLAGKHKMGDWDIPTCLSCPTSSPQTSASSQQKWKSFPFSHFAGGSTFFSLDLHSNSLARERLREQRYCYQKRWRLELRLQLQYPIELYLCTSCQRMKNDLSPGSKCTIASLTPYMAHMIVRLLLTIFRAQS